MSLLARLVSLTVAFAASSVASANADDVPLADSYGTLMACILGPDGSNAGPPDDSVAYVTPSRAQGLEWSCDYQFVMSVGNHKWSATGKCSWAGQESAPQIQISEDTAGKSVTVVITDTHAWDFTMKLSACSLPYAEQVELESVRLKALP